MTERKILVISGTHGNELNPIWGVNKFKDLNKDTTKLRSFEFTVGNPKAVQTGSRYIDVDLKKLMFILRLAFENRRKKIKNSMSDYRLFFDDWEKDKDLRPENIEVKKYCSLAKKIS